MTHALSSTRLDAPHARHSLLHCGVLVPWANTVVESELPRWSAARLAWHHARLVPAGCGTALDDDFLAGLVTAMPDALHQLSRLQLRRIYLACTSAAFTHGEGVRLAASAAQVAVVTAFDAIVAALEQVEAARVVLATPYPASVTEREAARLDERGISVLAHASLDLDDCYADVPAERIGRLVYRVPHLALARAEAVVLSCTGWPTRAVTESLSRRLQRPVISSNLAIAMHASSLVGASR